MSRTLPPLPYAMDALEPHISAETLDFHYNKHHASYLNKLNTLTKGGEHEDVSVGDLVRKGQKTLPASIYNNAAQVWNHTFYWMSLAPTSTPTEPSSRLMSMIDNSFGSMDDFQRKFSEIAAGHFGSGWAWLVQNSDGMLEIKDTHDAVSIWSDSMLTPVLACDVWEHAYYIDYRNDRAKYIDSWWKLVNWKFAEENIKFPKM